MFAIIEECYKNVTLQNDARQISTIKTGSVMNSVRDTFHFTDMTADMAFLSSEILSLRLPNVPATLFFSNNLIKRNHRQRYQANGVAKKCRYESRYFLEKFCMANARCTADFRPKFLLKGLSVLSLG